MRRATDSPMHSWHQRGVTLIEMIVAIVVTGILLALVGMFSRNQITSYFDVAARTELADAADTALRRIARELAGALPNSARVSAGADYIEFVPIKDGGRYRAAGPGSAFDVTQGGHCFEVFGPTPSAAAGDWLVIYNLGIPGASSVYATSAATADSTRKAIDTACPAGQIGFTGTRFPLASPQNRFHVVGGPVSYRCDVASGVVRRYWGYSFADAQPTPPATGSSSILVDGVTACTFSYTAGALQRNGLVSMQLTLTKNGESVTLLHQVNVVNTP